MERLFSFKKNVFADSVFNLMLVYRKQSVHIQEFSEMLKYLVAAYSIGIIAGYFHRLCPGGK